MKTILYSLLFVAGCFLAGCSDEDETAIKSPIDKESDLYGIVTDQSGNRLQGVVVSDGFSCTVTDENGAYQLQRNALAYGVMISLPEQYEVPLYNGLPQFRQLLDATRKRYDFVLTPLAGGVENEFTLFCIGDPQCQNATHVERFKAETAKDIAAQVVKEGKSCYAITLGDVIWNNAKSDYTQAIMPLMRLAMQEEKIGLPVFQLMGNHDNKVIAVKKADYTVKHDIAAQRNFEYALGPVNYSFNRGNVHIVAMDDIVFPNHDEYWLGFRDDQVEWLRQDLSFVPKSKMIILCVHIPLRNSSAQNVQNVLSLLEGYAEVHIMSGHTHYAENYLYPNGIYEHVHGAACGAWWNSTINTDGTPNGYGLFRIKGATITNWQYKGTNMELNDQIRLYRGTTKYMETSNNQYQFYYKGEADIVANIWNADKNWKVEVYENESKSGEMIPFEADNNRYDAWALGYHMGVLGKAAGSDYDRRSVTHLYHYTLQNPTATVRVVATDPFGNVYEQSNFTSGAVEDYPTVK